MFLCYLLQKYIHHEDEVITVDTQICIDQALWFNTLAPGRRCSSLRSVIYEHMLQIKLMSTFCETAIRWMPQNTFGDKSTLTQVIAWCHQTSSHYQSQCWPRSMSPHGITIIQQKISYRDIEFRVWIRHDIYMKLDYVSTHPCPNYNDNKAKLPLKLEHCWMITSHRKL